MGGLPGPASEASAVPQTFQRDEAAKAQLDELLDKYRTRVKMLAAAGQARPFTTFTI